jgi:uncharacterized protein
VDAAYRDAAQQLMRELILVDVDDEVLHDAAHVLPAEVRTLDAIHVASALAVGDGLGVAITYDARMTAALRIAGVPATAPGT